MKRRRASIAWWILLLAVVAGGIGGCASPKGNFDEALLAYRPGSGTRRTAGEKYRVNSPDRLEIAVFGTHPWSVQRTIGIDGRIRIPVLGLMRAAGKTSQEIGSEIGEKIGISADLVKVRVMEHQSQQVFIHGEVVGLQRVVSYEGPETVLDILQRAGGITPGAAPRNVQVVRTHVADGKAPEVFQVDLEAIVMKKAGESNVVVEPFDQIYIGQSRRSTVAGCMPPWVRPLYDSLAGLARAGRKTWEYTKLPKRETPPRATDEHFLTGPPRKLPLP